MFHYQEILAGSKRDIYRFPFDPVDSNMYFIPDGEAGIVFDPNENEELLSVFKQNGTRKVTIVLTHEHYDHTNGVPWLQSRIESQLFCHRDCARSIASEKGNDPKLVAFVLSAKDAVDGGHRYELFKRTFKHYTLQADETFDGESVLHVGSITIACYSMPGHSPGSSVFIWDGHCAFTGDSLIQNTPTILRFPESDKLVYERVTRPFLRSLDKQMMVYPGHGEPFRITEAKYL